MLLRALGIISTPDPTLRTLLPKQISSVVFLAVCLVTPWRVSWTAPDFATALCCCKYRTIVRVTFAPLARNGIFFHLRQKNTMVLTHFASKTPLGLPWPPWPPRCLPDASRILPDASQMLPRRLQMPPRCSLDAPKIPDCLGSRARVIALSS